MFYFKFYIEYYHCPLILYPQITPEALMSFTNIFVGAPNT